MNQNLSRRDFLKIAGVSLGALAFRPSTGFDLEYLSAPKPLPQFPQSDIIGRVLENGIRLRSQPNSDDTIGTVIAEMPADTLVEWGRQIVGTVTGLSNQRFVETPQGYVYSSVLQPTRNLPNTPIREMPAGQQGFWAEVTVPYIDLAHDGVVASPWMQDHIAFNFPPRLYYGQVVWIDRVRTENGFVEYRWNEDVPHGYGYGAYGEFFWGDGAGFKVLTDADVAPINPDVDPNEKKIDANLDYQTLS
ncbi:MAG TPA: hypothetical protein VFG81_06595, partial [Anaerolineales bacterium]|nr:hypothetical protein [Anaerolineales bacterium]